MILSYTVKDNQKTPNFEFYYRPFLANKNVYNEFTHIFRPMKALICSKKFLETMYLETDEYVKVCHCNQNRQLGNLYQLKILIVLIKLYNLQAGRGRIRKDLPHFFFIENDIRYCYDDYSVRHRKRPKADEKPFQNCSK